MIVSDLRQVSGFLWVLRFSPPIKLTDKCVYYMLPITVIKFEMFVWFSLLFTNSWGWGIIYRKGLYLSVILLWMHHNVSEHEYLGQVIYRWQRLKKCFFGKIISFYDKAGILRI